MEKVTVIGAGRSGIAAAKLLSAMGSYVFVTDQNQITADNKKVLNSLGTDFEEKGHTEKAYACDYAVVSPGIDKNSVVLKEAASRKIKIIPEIELAQMHMKAKLLAVTGTNGKSTTTALAAHILNESGMKCHVGGNLAPGIPLSEISLIAGPDEWVSAEISSFQMEHVSDFKADAAIWTNISRDHLDRHGNMFSYASLKADLIGRVKEKGFAILNFCDGAIARMTEKAACRKYFFGNDDRRVSGFVRNNKAVFRPDSGVEFSVDEKDLFLRGSHNLENILAAGLAGYFIGTRPNKIIEAVKSFKGLPHRLEIVGVFGGILFVNNSMCTNESAFRRSLEAYKGSVVIVGGKAKKTDLSVIAESCKELAKFVILIGVSSDELSLKLKKINVPHKSVKGMREAVEEAAKIAEEGDQVILNPGMASFDMFKDFQDRGEAFKSAVEEHYGKV